MNTRFLLTENSVQTRTTLYEKKEGNWYKNGVLMSFHGQAGKDLLNQLEEKIAGQVRLRETEERRKEYDQRDLDLYRQGKASNRAKKRLIAAGLIATPKTATYHVFAHGPLAALNRVKNLGIMTFEQICELLSKECSWTRHYDITRADHGKAHLSGESRFSAKPTPPAVIERHLGRLF